jgi:hypothetical protein
MGWICPLTPLENRLRLAADGDVYSSGFIEYYLVPVIYPQGFSREMFVALGVAVILINLAVYTVLFVKSKRRIT